MPRLTNADYLKHHVFLADLWQDRQFVYAAITGDYPRVLYDFYVPHKPELSDDELLAHRKRVSQEQSSLPARAGKALRALTGIYEAANHDAMGNDVRFRQAIRQYEMPGAVLRHTVPAQHGKTRTISVRAIRKPEPDIKQLARAIALMVEQQVRDELDLQNKNPPPKR